MDDRDLPTIRQIIEKADRLHGTPMSDDESEWWFAETVNKNKQEREDHATNRS